MKNIMKSLNLALVVIFTSTVFNCSTNTEELNPEIEANALNQLAKHPAKMYAAELNMLNDSGVSGTAELTLNGDQLTVIIYATGLEPDMLHPQHIHGFTENNRNSKCPPESADTNGNGYISVAEGAPFYGGILLPLMPFPMAPDGTIVFQETYTVTDTVRPLQNRAIVLHGMTVDGVYDASLPVACGQITPNQGK